MGNSPMRRFQRPNDWGINTEVLRIVIWVWVNTYRYITIVGWTSINPSYFDVNYRGTIGFDTLPYIVIKSTVELMIFHRAPWPTGHQWWLRVGKQWLKFLSLWNWIWLPTLHHLPRSWMICHSSSSLLVHSELEHWFTIKHELILTYRFTEIIDASFVWFAFQFSTLCPNLFFWAISQHWLREPVDGI